MAEEAQATGPASLEDVFLRYCQYGAKNNPGNMDGFTFAKLAKDNKLLSKSCTRTDIDLIFQRVKPKGGRVLDFNAFTKALDLVGARRFPKTMKTGGQEACTAKVVEALCAQGGPVANNVTKADKVRLHDDKSTYTGVYAKGGPTNVDKKITLSNLADRSSSDARGRKLS